MFLQHVLLPLVSIAFAPKVASVALVPRGLPFQYCNNGPVTHLLQISEVAINGCTRPPCVLHKGKDVDIIVTGNLSEQVGIGARIEVSARLGELDVPFPFFGNNFCKLPILGLGSNECPVPKGNTRLGFTGTLPAAAPNVQGDVTVRAYTLDQKLITCFKVYLAVAD